MAAVDDCVAIDNAEACYEDANAEPCYEGEEQAATPPAGTLSEPLAPADPSGAVESSLTFKAHEIEEQNVSFSTELEVMWQRLSGRGQSVAERMNMDMHKGAEALECESRDGALIQAFRALDVDNTGSLGVNALRALVTLDEPDANAKQVLCCYPLRQAKF